MLISIFILLLISVVAIALIVASGTESSLAGNYRSATGAYYASIAGLEEVRSRLRPQNPNSFKNTAPPAFVPPIAICSPVYVINPFGGEVVAPWDSASTYPDAEFNQEFAGICPPLPNPSPSTLSIWNKSPLNALPISGPLYKWVRINGVSEQSLQVDVVPYDGTWNDTVPIFYVYDNATGTGQLNNSGLGSQVLEITALAVLPNGSQKIVQYLVGQVPITLPPFLAALTLSGSNGDNPGFHAPISNAVYAVKGDGWDCNGGLGGPSARAIGIYGDYPGNSYNSAVAGVSSGIPLANQTKYTGSGLPLPDVEYLNASQTPTQLNLIVQTIIDSADAVVPAGSAATQTAFMTSLGMSPSNMMTVVANGDLDLTHWGNTGYGLLLVTGTFTMDPDNGWHGVILVIGQGKINNIDPTGNREFDGAVFVAKTNSGPDLGGASVLFLNDMEGNGIRYSNCWIQKARPMGSYRILSFHEVSQ